MSDGSGSVGGWHGSRGVRVRSRSWQLDWRCGIGRRNGRRGRLRRGTSSRGIAGYFRHTFAGICGATVSTDYFRRRNAQRKSEAGTVATNRRVTQ